MQQDGTEKVIILVMVAQEEQLDVVEVFLEKSDEENGSPKQQAPVEETDEEIEVEKADPSPLRGAKCFPRENTPSRIIWYPHSDGC
jgi:hypothetical protein